MWRACPTHLPLEVIEIRCLCLNSPLLLEDVTKSHKWGRNHLSGSGKELASAVMLRVTPMSPRPYFGVALEGVKFELEALVMILSCQEECLDFTSPALTCNTLLGWKCTEPTIENFCLLAFFPLNTSQDTAWFTDLTMAEETLQFCNLDRNSRIISWGHSDLDLWSQTRSDSWPLAAAALCSHCSCQLC